MDYADLLRTATLLASHVDPGDPDAVPTEANLRRAVSTAYYAAFHALSQSCADTLVGATPTDAAKEHWLTAYRTLDHRQVRNRFNNPARMANFPGPIRYFADRFINLQDLRHRADYDPDATFEADEVLQLLGDAREAIEGFNAAPETDRRLLAVYLIATLR